MDSSQILWARNRINFSSKLIVIISGKLLNDYDASLNGIWSLSITIGGGDEKTVSYAMHHASQTAMVHHDMQVVFYDDGPTWYLHNHKVKSHL